MIDKFDKTSRENNNITLFMKIIIIKIIKAIEVKVLFLKFSEIIYSQNFFQYVFVVRKIRI